MTNFKDDELSLNKLRDMSGGVKGDAQCHDQLRKAKGCRKTRKKSSWKEKPDSWSEIEKQENSTTTSAHQ